MDKLSIVQVEWLLVGCPRKGQRGFGPALIKSIGLKVEDYTVLNGVEITAEDKAAAKELASREEKIAKIKGRTFKTSEWRMERYQRGAAWARLLNTSTFPNRLKTLNGLKSVRFKGHDELVNHLNEVFPGVGFDTTFDNSTPAVASGGLEVAAMQTIPAAAPVVVEATNWAERLTTIRELHLDGTLDEDEYKAAKAKIMVKLTGE